jgi:hypothetical protein
LAKNLSTPAKPIVEVEAEGKVVGDTAATVLGDFAV